MGPVRAAWLAVAFAAILCLPLAWSPASAADERPTGGQVPTVTRLVKLFLEREAAVSDAIHKGDAQSLAGQLTDDFEMRTSARAATPVPRAEWMRDVLRTRDGGDDIGHMAVHDYGTLAVVSFTMTAKAGAIFVVDLWRGQGESWTLAVRYASPVAAAQFSVPGASSPEPGIPKKY